MDVETRPWTVATESLFGAYAEDMRKMAAVMNQIGINIVSFRKGRVLNDTYSMPSQSKTRQRKD
jgi:hypothetical protein